MGRPKAKATTPPKAATRAKPKQKSKDSVGSHSPAADLGKKSPAELLDDILPFIGPASIEAHLHAAVLEVSDPAQLVELAIDPAFRPFLLCRLAADVALVDPGRAAELAEALRKRGHTPKIAKS
jgi:hypothetical protein